MKMIFETERLKIELFDKRHIKNTVRFYVKNADVLREFEPERDPGFYTEKYHKKLYGYDRKDIKRLRYLPFVLIKKDDPGNIIGFVKFSDISFGVEESCRVGYKMDEDERNRGYMFEALKKLTEVMFREMKIHRIEADVMPSNKASLRLLEKLGFTQEGYMRKYLKINGRWQDHLRYALLNDERENENAGKLE